MAVPGDLLEVLRINESTWIEQFNNVWTELIVEFRNVNSGEVEKLSFVSWPFWISTALISAGDIGMVITLKDDLRQVLIRDVVIDFMPSRPIQIIDDL